MQSACLIRGWPGAEGRPVMYALIQGAGFPDGSAAVLRGWDKCSHYSHSGQHKCLHYSHVGPLYIEENMYLYCLLSHSAALYQV